MLKSQHVEEEEVFQTPAPFLPHLLSPTHLCSWEMRSGRWEEVKTPIFFTHQLPDASVSLLPDEDYFICLYRGALKINEMFLNTLKAPGTVIVLSIRRCTWLALLAHTKIEGGKFKRRVGALKTHPRAVSQLAWVLDRSLDATGWEQGDDDV